VTKRIAKYRLMQIKIAAYHLFQPLLRLLRNNRLIIRKLFGIRIPGDVAVQFDPTTLLLAKVLREVAQTQDRFALEVGIGQGALVGLSLAKGQPIELDGVDCSHTRVDSSKRVAQFNKINASFWVSDLFASVPVDKSYDLIFFNPPYVPTNVGEELRLTERLEVDGDQVWDGGEDGTSVLREFLEQARRFVSDHGRVVFGVQEIFVPQTKVKEVVNASPFQLTQRVVKRGIPSAVYVVAARNSQPVD